MYLIPVLLLLFPIMIHAEPDTYDWKHILDGWGIYDIEMSHGNPEFIYATAIRLLLSRDKGENWISITDSLFMSTFKGIAVAPSNPSAIYAASNSAEKGVLVSRDKGETWDFIQQEILNRPLRDISIRPDNELVVYISSTGSKNIIKTLDGGKTWNEVIVDSVISPSFQKIEFCPDNPDIVFVPSDEGVYRSEDGGNSWEKVINTYDFYDSFAGFWKIAIDPKNPDRVYALLIDGSNFDQVFYVSSDRGLSWDVLKPQGIPSWIVDFIIHPNTPSILYATIMSVEWALPVDDRTSFDFYPRVYKSIDGGENWKKISDGIKGESFSVMELAMSPLPPYILYAGCNGNKGIWTLEEPEGENGDFNLDGIITFDDFFLFADNFGGKKVQFDLNYNGVVDFDDFFIFADNFGK